MQAPCVFGLLVPGGRHGGAVVVVDSDLLAGEDGRHRHQGHHLAEPVIRRGHNMTLLSYHDPPGVLHPPEPDVRCEGVVRLVCEGDAVLVQPPHVGGDVEVKLRAEVDLQ